MQEFRQAGFIDEIFGKVLRQFIALSAPFVTIYAAFKRKELHKASKYVR